ncbi:MAG: hypothetical protein HYY40_13090 [Bacteroidetes bacterium]|nr:hypothetical protein [Bacteroidota bacterium]
MALAAIIVRSCSHLDRDSIQGDWITGTDEEKLKTIERQFRGLDIAMIETGYRYQELYWAGQDENWECAKYQLEKIKLTIENGLQRRPKRTKSAEYFLTGVLPEMQKAVENMDTVAFNKEFNVLAASCNSCHILEKVSFFTVRVPFQRQSPIRK